MLSAALFLLVTGTVLDYAEGKCANFDFESGFLSGWTTTGRAFNNQPTYGDNAQAFKPGKLSHQGKWWIGTYEDRPSPSALQTSIQGDGPIGTLTSPEFIITGSSLHFLLGGGCDEKVVGVRLLVDGVKVGQVTGICAETLKRVSWNVGKYLNRRAKVVVFDLSSGRWGHVNFDDLRGDITCKGVPVLDHFLIRIVSVRGIVLQSLHAAYWFPCSPSPGNVHSD